MSEVKAQSQFGIKGAYLYQVIDDATGDVIVDVPEQDNLITDGFLSQARPVPPYTYLCIGAGVVTPPTVTDTDLGNQIKSMSLALTLAGDYSLVPDVSPDTIVCKLSNTRDFTGFSGQSVSELGLRVGSGSGTLITRALIKDAGGNPTSITVNAGQTLRITYSLYLCLTAPRVGAGTDQVVGTPHGDLTLRWEWSNNPETIDSSQMSRLFSGLISATDWGMGGVSQRNFFGENVMPSTSVDLVGKKVTCTQSSNASTSQRTLGSFPINRHSGWTNPSPLWKVVGSYSVPANYNFSVSWEVEWGRLP